MKIKIEIDEDLVDEEIVIRCRSLDQETIDVQKRIIDAVNSRMQLEVTKDEKEYFLAVDDIFFLETDFNTVMVHTGKEIYQTKLRLYELEELLPGMFIRVSKSTILNTNKVRSIHKNLTGASEVEFMEGSKRAFVSRSYFKVFMSKLEEKRLKK